MESQTLPYIALGMTIAFAVFIAMAILVLNRLLGPKRPDEVKGSPFECGSDPVDSPRRRVNVRFYAVAIFFVVFDIEAVFLFPWAVLYRELLAAPGFGMLALAEIVLFLGILAVGLWYVWGKGALDWAFDAPGPRRDHG